MTSVFMTNVSQPASAPFASSSSASLSVPELLLLTEALVALAQQSAQTQQVSLSDVDWTSIAAMLSSRYPLSSSSSLTPNLLSAELLTHLTALSSASSSASSSSIPLAALITLSTSLKQQRLQLLKDEYAASTARQELLEAQVKTTASSSSSLPSARPDLPVPPTFPAPSSTGVGYPSTPLLMSPLQRSVSEKSRLPSTPLPLTAASIAHMPPLEESSMTDTAGDAAIATSTEQPAQDESALSVVKREAGSAVQVTPPPPLKRTITDMEIDREPEAELITADTDVATEQPQQQQQQQQHQQQPDDTAAAEPMESVDTNDASPTSSSSAPALNTSSSPTSRASSASLAATCLELLACLQRHPDAAPFSYPVDPADVPNYYEMIRQPMDLDTIQRQLQSVPVQIASPVQFHERLLLVFQNAYTFNDKKTSFYKMAKNLDAFAAELCRKQWPEQQRSFLASPEARKLTGRQSKSGAVGSGVKEVELDTPVGVMLVGVVSAPSSPSNDKDGSGAAAVGEEEAAGVAEEAEAAGRKSGRGGRGGVQSVATTPVGSSSSERIGTRKAVKGSKAEEEVAPAVEAEDGKAGGRKKGAEATSGRGRSGARRKSERGDAEEEEKPQEETKQQETPKGSRRGRGRGRGH